MSHSWQTTLRAEIKEALFRVGALGAVHRLRNRDTLTVLMFHRVVDPAAPAWSGSNPEFTMSTGFFKRLLGFIKCHYNPVGLKDVARALEGEMSLPPRALLVTFDDGWADNVEFAAPLLRAAGVPAVFFLATGAIKSGEAFWQEQFFAAAVAAGSESEAWRALEPDKCGEKEFLPRVLGVISALARSGADDGPRALRQLLTAVDCLMPQMMTPDDVTRLAEDPLFDFGTHGISHTPFVDMDDPVAELVGSWEDLTRWCAPEVQSLSFPHGRYTQTILDQAKSSGYELIFDSEQYLCRTGNALTRPSIGRFEVRPSESDPSGSLVGQYKPDNFDRGRIASEMFLRPISHGTSVEV